MKLLFTLLIAAATAQAGTVNFALTNFTSAPLPSNTVIQLFYTNQPTISGSWITTGKPIRINAPYGVVSTNLQPGDYSMTVEGITWANPLRFSVGTNVSYNLSEIATNASVVTSTGPFVLGITNTDGTVTITPSNGKGIVTISATGGTSPTNGVTALQATNIAVSIAADTNTALLSAINTASNAVFSAARSNLVNCINVRDFGAVGDGVTDDTAAIAAAFAAFNASTNYLNLYFPRGRYRDTGTHYVTKASADTPYHSRGDRTIYGEGSLSLVQIEATTGAWISVTNGMFNVRDMILYGPGPTVGAMSGIAMFGEDSYPTIERITVYNMSRYGLYFEGHRSVTINDTWLHQCWVGLGVGLGCDGLTFKGRLSGNSVGIEMGAMPYNVIADAPVIAGSRANGCRFDVVGGYNNDVLLIADGGGTLQLTLSGRIEDSRTVLMVGHQDRAVWTPATVVDSATLRTPAVGYSYAVLTGPVTVEGFYNSQNARTNITAAIEVYRPVHLVIRNSVLTPSTGKSTLYLASGAAASRINIQDSGLITLTNSTTNFEWGNNMRGVGTRDWLRANPQNLSDTAGINPGMSVFQDATTVYGLTLAKNTNSARWRMMSIAPASADFGWGFYAPGAQPTGNTNWYETLSLRGDNGGRIGIRSAAPAYTLDVSGDIRATNAIYANGFFGGSGSGITNIPLAGVTGLSNSLSWLTNNTGGGGTGAVSSVNGQTGDVTLDAAAVGAEPALGFAPQYGTANGTNWAAISTNIITDLRQEIADTTLDFAPQYGSANLTNLSAYSANSFLTWTNWNPGDLDIVRMQPIIAGSVVAGGWIDFWKTTEEWHVGQIVHAPEFIGSVSAANLTGTIDPARLPPSATNSIAGGISLSNQTAIYMLGITENTTLSAFGNVHASEFRTASLWVTNGSGSNCTVTLPAGTSCPDGNPLYVTNGQRRVVSIGGLINFTNAISRWLP